MAMKPETKEKLLFAINNILGNVDGEMLDEFIDHRWCVKDWEDLRDSLTTISTEVPEGPLDPHTVDVYMGCDDQSDPVGEDHCRVDAWGDDFLQFSRLIAEAESVGMWGGGRATKRKFKELCDAMDLDSEDVCEIIERAQRAFELMTKGL
jgi:hypothetical protein